MRETSKSHEWRIKNGHFEKYLHGSILDIGCGDDPLRPPNGTVRGWDKSDGDAMNLAGVPDNHFDAVFSSHCLEHLVDVPTALKNWVRVLKPGGYLYVVVPDYCLYEKLTWPSMFNPEHKQTFSLGIPRYKVGRDNHWGYRDTFHPLLEQLGIQLIELDDQDDGFDWNKGKFDQTDQRLGFSALCQIYFVGRKSA